MQTVEYSDKMLLKCVMIYALCVCLSVRPFYKQDI